MRLMPEIFRKILMIGNAGLGKKAGDSCLLHNLLQCPVPHDRYCYIRKLAVVKSK